MGHTGSRLHGEFSSANASALDEENSRILLYGAGSVSAVTLGAGDTVCVTSVAVAVGAALTVTVYDGANNTPAAGEQILKVITAAAGTAVYHLPVAHACQPGTWPKVKTSGAGQVDVTLHGHVTSVTPT